jgi:hypothetical protein
MRVFTSSLFLSSSGTRSERKADAVPCADSARPFSWAISEHVMCITLPGYIWLPMRNSAKI